MTNIKTKIPAGLKEFTETIATEQMKQVEEAIKEQNEAIEKLSQRLEDAISSINKQKPQPSEGLSKAKLEDTLDEHLSDFTGKFAEIMKNYLASFRGEVTTLRKERQTEHQELLDQRAHQHKVFIRIVIAIPAAALLILFSSGYLHYRNSSVYWGNRAYELAAKQKAEDPGALYQYVQENFSDSTKQERTAFGMRKGSFARNEAANSCGMKIISYIWIRLASPASIFSELFNSIGIALGTGCRVGWAKDIRRRY